MKSLLKVSGRSVNLDISNVVAVVPQDFDWIRIASILEGLNHLYVDVYLSEWDENARSHVRNISLSLELMHPYCIFQR